MFGIGKKTKEIQRKQAIIDSLKAENLKLRMEIADKTKEANEAIEAKEIERQELCDQLGEAQRLCNKQKSIIEVKTNTIGRLIKENMWLTNTNSNLSDLLNLKRNDKSRVKHPISENK